MRLSALVQPPRLVFCHTPLTSQFLTTLRRLVSVGGNVIPQPIVNLKMAYKLVDDVGHFLDWVRDSRRRRQQHTICDAT